MLVTDTGVWVRALAEEGPMGPVRERLEREGSVAAPAMIDLEFLSALRGMVFKGLTTPPEAEEAISEFQLAPIHRYLHGHLMPRVWELRQNLTPYDASYVALAESLGATLYTLDSRIGGAPGLRCSVEIAG